MTHNKLINDAIDRFKQKQLIPKEAAETLKLKDRKAPKFHMLPKIHKINNLGRPVVSSIGCHSTNISKFVDYHLQPIVKNIPSCVQDSNDFLNKIDTAKNIPADCLLVTMDVKSLYTKIPDSEGISAVKAAYESYPEKSVTKKVIITFLALILALNNFMFNCKNYLQIRGCTSLRGNLCKHLYGKIEQKHIYPFIKGKVDLYLRYIDEIFFIWKGRTEELKNFFNEINKKHPSIKFNQK